MGEGIIMILAVLGFVYAVFLFIWPILIYQQLSRLEKSMGRILAFIESSERHLAALHQVGINVEQREARKR